MLPVVVTAFDASWFYETVANLASSLALWATMRAERAHETPEEALQDLELRLRHPWKYRTRQVTRLFK